MPLTWTRADAPVGYLFIPPQAFNFIWAQARLRYVTIFQLIADSTYWIGTSPDGLAWTVSTNPLPTLTGQPIVGYSPTLDRFIAADTAVAEIYSSDDLETWTQRQAAQGDGISSVSFASWDDANARFLTIPQTSGHNAFTSSDGLTWTLHAPPRTDDPADTVGFGQAVGLSTLLLPVNDNSLGGDTFVFSSTDGLTWATTGVSFIPITQVAMQPQGGTYYGGAQENAGSFPSSVYSGMAGLSIFSTVYPSNAGIFAPSDGLITGTVVFNPTIGYLTTHYPPDGGGCIVRSEDGGMTWTRESVGVPADDDQIGPVAGYNDTSVIVLSFGEDFVYVASFGAPAFASLDQLVVEIVFDAALLANVVTPSDGGWDTLGPPGGGGGGIPRGPGECAGVAYGIGVIGGPGGIAGTGDPMSTVSIDLKQFFGGVTNAPPALGFLYAYAAGSSTPIDTFANSALSTPNTNPVELDADGNPPNVIYLGPSIYKFDLQDANHVSLPGFPIDNIAGSVWPGQVLGAVTVNPAANADGVGHSLSATLNKASSGTHALFALLKLLAPTIGAGSATLTEAATFYVAGPPLGGTTRYAVHIAQGDVLITDSASKIGFFGKAPIAQPLLATGAGHTVDDVITVLQALGLCKQA